MKKRLFLIAFATLGLSALLIISGCENRYEPHGIEISNTESKTAKLPELYVEGEPAKITYEQVKGIKRDMTYGQVVEMLGATKDIGSGVYVLEYQLEDGKSFVFSVVRWDDPIGKTGEDLLAEMAIK